METALQYLKREKRYVVEGKFDPLAREYRKIISFDFLDIAQRYFANEAFSGCRFHTIRLVDTSNGAIIDEFYNF